MDGDAGQLVATPRAKANGDGPDVHARRAEIVSRLLERGMSVRVLHALLPGWDDAIRTAGPNPAPVPRSTDASTTPDDRT